MEFDGKKLEACLMLQMERKSQMDIINETEEADDDNGPPGTVF